DAVRAGRVVDDQPVLTSFVELIAARGFVARAVHEAEQVPVKLRQAAGVRGIQDHLYNRRKRPGVFHALDHTHPLARRFRTRRIGGRLRTMAAYPSPKDLDAIGARYSVPRRALEDLVARRRAGAHDDELISLLRQPDWGDLSQEQAEQLVAELPG